MALTLEHFTDEDEAALRAIFDGIARIENQVGVTEPASIQAHQRSFTTTVRWANKVDVTVAGEFALRLDSAAGQLCLIAKKLLGLPDDYEPEAGA
jgi:hypothetical protein